MKEWNVEIVTNFIKVKDFKFLPPQTKINFTKKSFPIPFHETNATLNYSMGRQMKEYYLRLLLFFLDPHYHQQHKSTSGGNYSIGLVGNIYGTKYIK
ncbi:hypothetical protein Hanom_Chr09g00820961 [Helianthus anomalus]